MSMSIGWRGSPTSSLAAETPNRRRAGFLPQRSSRQLQNRWHLNHSDAQKIQPPPGAFPRPDADIVEIAVHQDPAADQNLDRLSGKTIAPGRPKKLCIVPSSKPFSPKSETPPTSPSNQR